MSMNESKVYKAVDTLQGFWSERNKAFKEWYDIILMTDKLKTEDMESFAGNDPRTFYNMSLHLLRGRIPHRIPMETIKDEELDDATEVEGFLEYAWGQQDRKYRERGMQSWLWYFVSLLISTGWYSVFGMADDVECIAEVWNPAEVFPEFSEDGLVQVAKKYTMTGPAAAAKIALKKWPYKGSTAGNVTVRDLWYYEGTSVINAIMMENTFVKPPTSHSEFERIPVLIGPVAGLPDKGSIMSGGKWQKNFGESIVATNEQMYNQYNKQRSFSNQLLRDTAQPRWFERSASGEILQEDKMFKRGGVFKGGPGDEILPLPVPAIPVELRTDRFDDQGMIQRGSIPWAIQGNLQGQMSGYLMSQISSAVHQILEPYLETIIFVTSEIDNRWLKMIEDGSLNPYEKKLPSKCSRFVVDTKYELDIPGDIVQRATVARMLNPNFELATDFVIDKLFPEITNPTLNSAKVRRDRAMSHPISVMINQIIAFKQQAELLKGRKQGEMAKLYEQAAAALQAQIIPQQAPMPTQPPTGAPTQPAGTVGEAGTPGSQIMEQGTIPGME